MHSSTYYIWSVQRFGTYWPEDASRTSDSLSMSIVMSLRASGVALQLIQAHIQFVSCGLTTPSDL